MSSSSRALAIVLLAAGSTAIGPGARADEPASATTIDKRAAQRSFAEGEKAFERGDFVGAAEAFEAAYKAAPHVDPLWNAARAWHRAGESARAANRYAKYLRDAPADAADRDNAAKAIEELSAKIGRVDVYAPGLDAVTIDGAPIDGASAYVNPGTHVLEGRAKDKTITRRATVDAGGVVSVALVDEPAPPPSVAAPAPSPTVVATTPPPPIVTAPPPSKGLRVLSPWIFVGESVLVATGVGLIIASGVDTDSAKSAYDADPEKHVTPVVDDGLSREHRTNILIGVTAGVAALSGATAIWLVDWSGTPKPNRVGATMKLGAGIGSLHLAGSFR